MTAMTGSGPTGADPGLAVPATARPRLAPYVRRRFDRARGRHVLLGPESVIVLNATGADILELCDGRREVAEIVSELRGRYHDVGEDEVPRFLARLVARHLVVLDRALSGGATPGEGSRDG
jgi:pyrroloquinoline quinone biosynthesis protein D